MQRPSFTRRDFLSAAACGAAATVLPAPSLSAAPRPLRTGERIKGRKLNIASVGCGGQGGRFGRADPDDERGGGRLAAVAQGGIHADFPEYSG